MFSSRSAPFLRLVALMLAITMTFVSVVAVSAQEDQDQLQQLEEERQFLEEERQRLEEEIQQIEQEQRQVEQEIQRLEQQDQQRQAEQVTLRELIRNPEDFEGQLVQLTGDLEETLLPHTFALESRGRQVIVLAAPQDVPDNAQEVTVVGTVHLLTLGDLLRSLGIDVSRSEMEFFLGDANDLILIAAQRVTSGPEAAEEEEQEGRLDQVEEVTVRDLTRNPQDFANQDVLLSGEVGEDLGRQAFTVRERGQEVLVVGDRLTIPDELGGVVEVLGQARESFDIRDVEDDLGIQLTDRQFRDFEGQPFVLAETVSSSELDRPVPGAGG